MTFWGGFFTGAAAVYIAAVGAASVLLGVNLFRMWRRDAKGEAMTKLALGLLSAITVTNGLFLIRQESFVRGFIVFGAGLFGAVCALWRRK